MTRIGIVSPGAMGSALGRVWQSRGHEVLATVEARSARTRRLAVGLTLLAGLDDVIASSDVVVSVCPPGVAEQSCAAIVAAARRVGTHPLIADLNAISPGTATRLSELAHAEGLDLVDGAISGPPPHPDREPGTLLYLSGPEAAQLAALTAPGLRPIVVGPRVGQASGVKMCTASVYKGTTALWTQALQTAERLGVLDFVSSDLAESYPETVDAASRMIASATSKSARFVAEMEQISATQAEAGLTAELFEGIAEVYRRLAKTPLATVSPEQAAELADLQDVLSRLDGDS